jgi:hypothetical protein
VVLRLKLATFISIWPGLLLLPDASGMVHKSCVESMW